ncbi:WG repeat-containing protein [Acidovorax sp. Root219]|uniref:WG repeat-containing protein n=1 Tax=Acidovorax sp. Root219 TaxID=1736493 RepID=UPI00070A3629|nr:WG repeat-containing protein [Acidovorax sp. Root219]KRC28991.1 hypothetical protein ASE28_18845 [Acidovorax sp. Root219]
MNKHTPPIAAPWIASIPLSADGAAFALLIVHPGRAIAPPEGLRAVMRFNADGEGGFVAAAMAGDGCWGYIDAEGHWRVPPTLENARDYSEDGLARFCQGGRWGFVNLAGEVVIAPAFEDARPFRGGLCAVMVGKNAWRIIDREGKFTCEESFRELSTFGAGALARAVSKAKGTNQLAYGYVDGQGRWVIEPRFQRALPFGEQPATAASLDGETYGLIDARGQWVLEPRYPDIRAFNKQGLAYFDEPDSWDNGHGYLDAKGRVVIKGERHLSRHMVHGMVCSDYNGAGYLRADGKALDTPSLVYGSHFRSEGGFAVVRTAASAAHKGHAGRPAAWALLHPDGRVASLAEPLLEPLTNGDGWLVEEMNDTPLVPFLTRDGQVAYLDRYGAVVWRAQYDGQHATLLDAQGQALWRSDAQEGDCRAPHPFFLPPITDHLEGIDTLGGIVPLAETLLAEAEARLHRLAAGQTLEREPSPDGDDDDDEDGDDDEDTVQANRAVVLRRVMRTYISEEHNGPYEFLCSELSDAVNQAREAMLQALEARYGPADPDPEHAAPWHGAERTQAWAVPMAQALPGDTGVLHESREQWVTLYKSSDSGDGDAWWELWLMVAPSLDALETAQRARLSLAAQDSDGADEEGDVGGDDSSPVERLQPQTREEWLQAVASDRYAIAQVPAAWLDDAMVDAALASDVEALAWVPGRLQTPERLQALIRRGVDEAASIPPECMTAEGLALARGLYADSHEWDWRDERNSRIPTSWDHNSLCDVWGCLLTPELALKAVRAKAPLRDLAHWLRTDEVEKAALKADIYNISYIDKSKITPELAARAVRHDYGTLIEVIPPEMITPALCLVSARTNGLSLEKMPEPLRSVPVCVAALKDRSDVFPHVPEALRMAVITQLIEDDLAEARRDGEPREGSHWHGYRAWVKLWAEDYEGAIADAKLGLPEMRYEQHANYVLASAYMQLGREAEAALEASTVLSLQSPYSAQWNDDEDTRWLQALVQEHAGAADDDALVEQLLLHPRTLADIPRERITRDMVNAALESDEDTVRFVPRRLMTPSLYTLALRQGVKQFEQIPPDMLGEEACIEHVKGGGWRLEYVPEAWRTLTVCAHAVRRSSSAIEHVPEALRKQVPDAIKQLPPEEDEEGSGSGSSSAGDWLTRKLVDSVVSSQQTASGRLQQKGLFTAFILKTMLGAKSDDTPTLKGLAGWFEVRPFLAMVTNLAMGLAALVGHAFVSVGAWRAEGPWVGLGTFALMGFSELYWAWRFVFSTPFRPGLGVACLVVMLYVFAWRWMYRRIGLVYAGKEGTP